jgi:hypothetical protein
MTALSTIRYGHFDRLAPTVLMQCSEAGASAAGQPGNGGFRR